MVGQFNACACVEDPRRKTETFTSTYICNFFIKPQTPSAFHLIFVAGDNSHKGINIIGDSAAPASIVPVSEPSSCPSDATEQDKASAPASAPRPDPR